MDTITRRIDPCACGCGGDDPWHARTFRRVLSDIKEECGRVKVHAYREPMEIMRSATARLPWGEGRPVRVVEVAYKTEYGSLISCGWHSTSEVL